MRPSLKAVAAPLLFLLLLVCGAGEALAADPIDLGPADSRGPGLALTAGGAAALTYATESSPGVDTLHYCRIDPGAGGCSASAVLANPLAEFKTDVANQPLVEGATIRVLQTRAKGASAEDHFLWSGEPFGSGLTLGSTEGTPGAQLDFGEAVLAPAGTVNAGATVIATVGTGPSVAPILTATGLTAASGPGSTFHFTTDSTSDATISAQGSLLSLAYIDQTLGDAVLWRRYTGGTGTPASIQSAGGWAAPVQIGEAVGGGDQVRMVTGPNGLYVVYVRPGDEAVVAAHYNGVAFEPPVAISPAGVQRFAVSEDSAGLLHLFYGTFDGYHYRYATDASNTTFSNPQTLPEHAYREARIAVAANGAGWLSYSDNDNGHDFVLPLAAGEPAPPSPPATGGGGGGSIAGGGGTTPTRPVTHPGGAGGPTATTTGSLGHGLVGELSTPKECVAGGQIFKAKVAVKRKGSQAHKASYTVKQVIFFLGGKKVTTDKRKPFETSFATKGLGKGAALAVSAKISVIVHAGHHHSTVSKTLKTTVTTCK